MYAHLQFATVFSFVIYSSLLTGKKYLMEKGNEFYYGIYNFHNIELRTHFDFQFIYSKSYAICKWQFRENIFVSGYALPACRHRR